ncbi:MAG TPA: aldo/keto reductase [Acidimicrobiales bacterium]|nr:aldo/keto reductase [Acidimicrobiales bacterium]
MPLGVVTLGTTGLKVTNLAIGTSALGSMPSVYGYEVERERALETLRRALDSPLRMIDTSNGYGGGNSERLIGEVLRERDGAPEGMLVSTKVDPDHTGDFSGARVRRSVEESCERLNMDYLPLLFLHDPERVTFEESMAPEGAVPALVKLKQEGVVGHLGVAGGPVGLLERYVRTGVFEALLTHNRLTLLDRSASSLVDECVRLGVSVLNAAPFGGGMLARGPHQERNYGYRRASPELVAKANAIAATCSRYEVPMAVAALQFSLRDPRVASTVVGVTRPERVDQAIEMASYDVPEALWPEVASLAAPPELWLW